MNFLKQWTAASGGPDFFYMMQNGPKKCSNTCLWPSTTTDVPGEVILSHQLDWPWTIAEFIGKINTTHQITYYLVFIFSFMAVEK